MTAPHHRYYPPTRTLGFAPAGHPYKVNPFKRFSDLSHTNYLPTVVHIPKASALQLEKADAAIDALVYELYRLTQEEVKVVEGNTNN